MDGNGFDELYAFLLETERSLVAEGETAMDVYPSSSPSTPVLPSSPTRSPLGPTIPNPPMNSSATSSLSVSTASAPLCGARGQPQGCGGDDDDPMDCAPPFDPDLTEIVLSELAAILAQVPNCDSSTFDSGAFDGSGFDTSTFTAAATTIRRASATTLVAAGPEMETSTTTNEATVDINLRLTPSSYLDTTTEQERGGKKAASVSKVDQPACICQKEDRDHTGSVQESRSIVESSSSDFTPPLFPSPVPDEGEEEDRASPKRGSEGGSSEPREPLSGWTKERTPSPPGPRRSERLSATRARPCPAPPTAEVPPDLPRQDSPPPSSPPQLQQRPPSQGREERRPGKRRGGSRGSPPGGSPSSPETQADFRKRLRPHMMSTPVRGGPDKRVYGGTDSDSENDDDVCEVPLSSSPSPGSARRPSLVAFPPPSPATPARFANGGGRTPHGGGTAGESIVISSDSEGGEEEEEEEERGLGRGARNRHGSDEDASDDGRAGSPPTRRKSDCPAGFAAAASSSSYSSGGAGRNGLARPPGHHNRPPKRPSEGVDNRPAKMAKAVVAPPSPPSSPTTPSMESGGSLATPLSSNSSRGGNSATSTPSTAARGGARRHRPSAKRLVTPHSKDTLMVPLPCPDPNLMPVWRVLKEWSRSEGSSGDSDPPVPRFSLPPLPPDLSVNVLSRVLSVDLSRVELHMPPGASPPEIRDGTVYYGSGTRPAMTHHPLVQEAARVFHDSPRSASLYLEEFGQPITQLERLVDEFMLHPLGRLTSGSGSQKLGARDRRLQDLCFPKGHANESTVRGTVACTVPHLAHAITDGRPALALPHIAELVRVCRRYDGLQKAYLMAVLRRVFAPLVFTGLRADGTLPENKSPTVACARALRRGVTSLEEEAARRAGSDESPVPPASGNTKQLLMTCIASSARLLQTLGDSIGKAAINLPGMYGPGRSSPRRRDLSKLLPSHPEVLEAWSRAMDTCSLTLAHRVVVGASPPENSEVADLVDALGHVMGIVSIPARGDARGAVQASQGWRAAAQMLYWGYISDDAESSIRRRPCEDLGRLLLKDGPDSLMGMPASEVVARCRPTHHRRGGAADARGPGGGGVPDDPSPASSASSTSAGKWTTHEDAAVAGPSPSGSSSSGDPAKRKKAPKKGGRLDDKYDVEPPEHSKPVHVGGSVEAYHRSSGGGAGIGGSRAGHPSPPHHRRSFDDDNDDEPGSDDEITPRQSVHDPLHSTSSVIGHRGSEQTDDRWFIGGSGGRSPAERDTRSPPAALAPRPSPAASGGAATRSPPDGLVPRGEGGSRPSDGGSSHAQKSPAPPTRRASLHSSSDFGSDSDSDSRDDGEESDHSDITWQETDVEEEYMRERMGLPPPPKRPPTPRMRLRRESDDSDDSGSETASGASESDEYYEYHYNSSDDPDADEVELIRVPSIIGHCRAMYPEGKYPLGLREWKLSDDEEIISRFYSLSKRESLRDLLRQSGVEVPTPAWDTEALAAAGGPPSSRPSNAQPPRPSNAQSSSSPSPSPPSERPSSSSSPPPQAILRPVPVDPGMLREGDVYRRVPHDDEHRLTGADVHPYRQRVYVPRELAEPAMELVRAVMAPESDWSEAFARDPAALQNFNRRAGPGRVGGKSRLKESLAWTQRFPPSETYDLVILCSEAQPGDRAERAFVYSALSGRACLPGSIAWPDSWEADSWPRVSDSEGRTGRTAVLCTDDLGYVGACEAMVEKTLRAGRACLVVDARSRVDGTGGPWFPQHPKLLYVRTAPASGWYLRNLPGMEDRAGRLGYEVGHVVMDGPGDDGPLSTRVLKRLRRRMVQLDKQWDHRDLGRPPYVRYPRRRVAAVRPGQVAPDLYAGETCSNRAVTRWGVGALVPVLPLAARWQTAEEVPEEVLMLCSDAYRAPGGALPMAPLTLHDLRVMRMNTLLPEWPGRMRLVCSGPGQPFRQPGFPHPRGMYERSNDPGTKRPAVRWGLRADDSEDEEFEDDRDRAWATSWGRMKVRPQILTPEQVDVDILSKDDTSDIDSD